MKIKKKISITMIYIKMATIDTTGYASDVVVGSALPIEMSYQLPASLKIGEVSSQYEASLLIF